jgi:DNA-3-methyladenine glycosylase
VTIDVKRVYEAPEPDDGTRVLVDRLWPRGVSKERAHVDRWCKEVAPSTELRHWFHHEPDRFAEFERRYRAELAGNPEVAELAVLGAGDARLTLLYSARDTEHNQARVLRDVLQGYLEDTASGSDA